MKTNFLTYTLVFAIMLMKTIIADSNTSIIELANEDYKNGEFSEAIEKYNQVLNSGYESAELYYNLGNAYYKSGEFAEALLFMEKAKLLNPADEDINFNLELIQSHSVDKIEAIPELTIKVWYKNLRSKLSSDTWAWIALISSLIVIILFSVFLYSRASLIKQISFWISALVFMSFVFTSIFAFQEKRILVDRNHAIIFSPSVTAKSSPDESGTDLFPLHEGTKVLVKDSLGNWREIQLSDGKVGWLKKEDIRVI